MKRLEYLKGQNPTPAAKKKNILHNYLRKMAFVM